VNFILTKPYNNNKIKIDFTHCNARAFFLVYEKIEKILQVKYYYATLATKKVGNICSIKKTSKNMPLVARKKNNLRNIKTCFPYRKKKE
jgi:hypothetical protein